MYPIIIIVFCTICIELLLRYFDKKSNPLQFEISQYPYYLYKRNTSGRQPWFLNRLGPSKTPTINIEAEGIRGHIELTDKEKIFIFGCSFTEGGGLPIEKTYPYILNQLINTNNYQVINAGISGYGIFQIESLINKFVKYNPKIIIVQTLDFKRIPLDSNKIAIARKQLHILQLLRKVSHLLLYIYRRILLNKDYLSEPYYFHNAEFTNDKAWDMNLSYLNKIVTVCKKHNISLVFFQWPGLTFFNKKISEYAKKHSIYACDLTETYSYYQLEELQLDVDDSHPNELANRLIAKGLANFLYEKESVTK